MSSPARAVGLLLLLAMFVVGGLAGMAAEEALGLDWFDFLDEDERRAEAELFTGLALTAAQRERMEDILDRREDRLEDYWEARLPDLHRIMGDAYGEMREVLTPEQLPVFDRRVREAMARTDPPPGD